MHAQGFERPLVPSVLVEKERERERDRKLLTPLLPTKRWVGTMPGGFDSPPCPGERERERQKEHFCATLAV